MSTKAHCDCHLANAAVHLNSLIKFGDFESQPKIVSSELEKPGPEDCKTMSNWSVRSLRKLFLQKIVEGDEPKSKCADVNAIKIKEHYEGSELYETSSSGTEGGKSVKELRKMYEAKVKALASSADKDVDRDHTCLYACSRPTTAGTEERQDTLSLDTPHPDGRNAAFEEPGVAKSVVDWHVASTNIRAITNGLQLSIVLMNGH